MFRFNEKHFSQNIRYFKVFRNNYDRQNIAAAVIIFKNIGVSEHVVIKDKNIGRYGPCYKIVDI